VSQSGRDTRSPGRASRIFTVAATREVAATMEKAGRATQGCLTCDSTVDQAGRFIWHVVGVLEMYDSNVFSRVQVLPVFSTSMLFFASTLFQVAR
jgi:hypothetical protein